MAEAVLVEGVVGFSNVTKKDVYQGKETNYNVTLTLDEATAQKLSSLGVKIKDWKQDDGTVIKQRKLYSHHHFPVVNLDGSPYVDAYGAPKEIPRGSKVRCIVKPDPERVHAIHGVPPYLNAVKVLEEAESNSVVEGF